MKIELYTDGGVILHNPSQFGGTYAWVLLIDGREYVSRSGILTPDKMKTETVTNNQMELWAVICGVVGSSAYGKLNALYSDSQVTLGRLFKDWKLNGIPSWMSDMVPRIRWNLRGVEPVLVKGHAGNRWNEYCDKLCQQEYQKFMAKASRKVTKQIRQTKNEIQHRTEKM